MTSKRFLLTFVLLSGVLLNLQAQPYFKGYLNYKMIPDKDAKNVEFNSDPIQITVGENRMLISSSLAVGPMKQFTKGVEGLLVRSDQQDILLLDADNKQAMQVTKSSIQMLFSLLEGISSAEDKEKKNDKWESMKSSDWVIEEQVAKMKILNEDATLKRFSYISEEGKKSDILLWEADNWNMDWGILSSNWMKKNSSSVISDSFFSHFQKMKVPMRMEFLEDGKRKLYVECIGFNPADTEADLKLPTGYEVVDIMGMVMRAMMSGGN